MAKIAKRVSTMPGTGNILNPLDPVSPAKKKDETLQTAQAEEAAGYKAGGTLGGRASQQRRRKAPRGRGSTINTAMSDTLG